MLLPKVQDTVASQLSEFDVWITPSLGEIADTDRFKEELELVSLAFDTIGKATKNFDSVDRCHPDSIAETLAQILHRKSETERDEILRSLASALFSVTGKSDNNFKCQFPLFLRDQAKWTSLPVPKRRNGAVRIVESTLPRTLTSERLMSIISQIDDPSVEASLLGQFLAFLLKDKAAINQFWALGHSYFALKDIGKERDLLAPIVVFKVRGSVMASGGHEPERMLRELLIEWGLTDGVDFNTNDVVIVDAEHDPEEKTRAYDFVLPYKTPGWKGGWSKRLFIQCQFYAGDSGSVSHKNVDQTRSSRDSLSRFVDEPTFIEYVDGAGYFSSLNGDLRRLLSYEDTHGLIQIRSAPLRLRYYFERLGFIPPIKVEETVALGFSSRESLQKALLEDGYQQAEVSRSIAACIENGLLVDNNGNIKIASKRANVVRRYLLLSIAAVISEPVEGRRLSGKVFVPGYGPFTGVELDRLADCAIEHSPVFREMYRDSSTLLGDIRWLSEKGYVFGA